MSQQVAWLGLGNMGRGMAKNLVEKGNLSKPLIIYNRTRARSEKLAEALGKDKVVIVDSVKEAVQKSDVIFSCLGDDAAIKDTISQGVEVDVKGKVFAECSTVLPETTNELAETITNKGGIFVASPVFGAPAVADAGQLVFVLAGPKAAVEKVKPFTTGVMGRAIIDMSDKEYGHASTLKIAGNAVVMSMIEGIAEGHVLAEKTGLGVQAFHEFISTQFGGPFAAYSNRMITGDYYKREEPLFGVDLARKDAKHMLTLAARSGTKLGNVEVADAHYQIIQKQMGSRGDLAGLYGANRLESGLPFENQ